MAESTFQNEVYIDVYGKVCDKSDKNALRKISRQEAVRQGLLSASEAPPPITDDTIIMHADGGSHRIATGVGLNAAPQNLGNPEEVRVTNPKEESLRVQGKDRAADAVAEEDEDDLHGDTDINQNAKAVHAAPEDKAVHKAAPRK